MEYVRSGALPILHVCDSRRVAAAGQVAPLLALLHSLPTRRLRACISQFLFRLLNICVQYTLLAAVDSHESLDTRLLCYSYTGRNGCRLCSSRFLTRAPTRDAPADGAAAECVHVAELSLGVLTYKLFPQYAPILHVRSIYVYSRENDNLLSKIIKIA